MHSNFFHSTVTPSMKMDSMHRLHREGSDVALVMQIGQRLPRLLAMSALV